MFKVHCLGEVPDSQDNLTTTPNSNIKIWTLKFVNYFFSFCSCLLFCLIDWCGRVTQPLPHTSNTHSYYHSVSLLLACISYLFVLIPTHWSFITQNKSFPCITLNITYLYPSMHWACSGGFSTYWPSCACFFWVVLSCLTQHLTSCTGGLLRLSTLYPQPLGGVAACLRLCLKVPGLARC